MPGVDFNAVRATVSMASVLEWIGFTTQSARGDQLRGRCPVHEAASRRSRSFSVNLVKGICKCHRCGFSGNQIQLWAKLHGMTTYEAALDICWRAGVQVPWVIRW